MTVVAPASADPGRRDADTASTSPLAAPTDAAPDPRIAAVQATFDAPRFDGIVRLHTAADVVAQQGTIAVDHTVARHAAIDFHALLRERFAAGRAITTFGPYSPGQAVTMRRAGIEAIYLGGWATSAKGSTAEDPGPDLASYPLSQVPDEAATLVRALLAADRDQHFLRSRMTPEARAAVPAIDYRPFIVADADTGHGGEAHVRNLIRRFVEVGVPAYHIEDQKPGAKKCGHQAGKVLVAQDEQLKRLNAARFQLDIMGVPGIIVARTDAESATLLDGAGDERDQPFVLGATDSDVPPYRIVVIALQRRLHAAGVDAARGHLLSAVPADDLAEATGWLEAAGLIADIDAAAASVAAGAAVDATLDAIEDRVARAWASEAELMTLAEATRRAIDARRATGDPVELDEGTLAGMDRAAWSTLRAIATRHGLTVTWDAGRATTPDGYLQVRGGIDYAIAKSLAAAPFADILWMETKTADLDDAARFAEAIHAAYPDKMLAYNLSPSFNWDTTGLSDEAMRGFPAALGRLGFVFDFITYGGHQIDGLAAETFAADLLADGMLALARLQRRLRTLESPYRTPQSLVGGDRQDAALMAASGRTAATRAMGAGSTQHQHLVQTELPRQRLAAWLAEAADAAPSGTPLRVALRPRPAASDTLELRVADGDAERVRITAAVLVDGEERRTLVITDGHADGAVRGGPIPALAVLFLLARERAAGIQLVAATPDLRAEIEGMTAQGLVRDLASAGMRVVVGEVDRERVAALAADDATGVAARAAWLAVQPGRVPVA